MGSCPSPPTRSELIGIIVGRSLELSESSEPVYPTRAALNTLLSTHAAGVSFLDGRTELEVLIGRGNAYLPMQRRARSVLDVATDLLSRSRAGPGTSALPEEEMERTVEDSKPAVSSKGLRLWLGDDDAAGTASLLSISPRRGGADLGDSHPDDDNILDIQTHKFTPTTLPLDPPPPPPAVPVESNPNSPLPQPPAPPSPSLSFPPTHSTPIYTAHKIKQEVEEATCPPKLPTRSPSAEPSVAAKDDQPEDSSHRDDDSVEEGEIRYPSPSPTFQEPPPPSTSAPPPESHPQVLQLSGSTTLPRRPPRPSRPASPSSESSSFSFKKTTSSSSSSKLHHTSREPYSKSHATSATQSGPLPPGSTRSSRSSSRGIGRGPSPTHTRKSPHSSAPPPSKNAVIDDSSSARTRTPSSSSDLAPPPLNTTSSRPRWAPIESTDQIRAPDPLQPTSPPSPHSPSTSRAPLAPHTSPRSHEANALRDKSGIYAIPVRRFQSSEYQGVVSGAKSTFLTFHTPTATRPAALFVSSDESGSRTIFSSFKDGGKIIKLCLPDPACRLPIYLSLTVQRTLGGLINVRIVFDLDSSVWDAVDCREMSTAVGDWGRAQPETQVFYTSFSNQLARLHKFEALEVSEKSPLLKASPRTVLRFPVSAWTSTELSAQLQAGSSFRVYICKLKRSGTDVCLLLEEIEGEGRMESVQVLSNEVFDLKLSPKGAESLIELSFLRRETAHSKAPPCTLRIILESSDDQDDWSLAERWLIARATNHRRLQVTEHESLLSQTRNSQAPASQPPPLRSPPAPRSPPSPIEELILASLPPLIPASPTTSTSQHPPTMPLFSPSDPTPLLTTKSTVPLRLYSIDEGRGRTVKFLAAPDHHMGTQLFLEQAIGLVSGRHGLAWIEVSVRVDEKVVMTFGTRAGPNRIVTFDAPTPGDDVVTFGLILEGGRRLKFLVDFTSALYLEGPFMRILSQWAHEDVARLGPVPRKIWLSNQLSEVHHTEQGYRTAPHETLCPRREVSRTRWCHTSLFACATGDTIWTSNVAQQSGQHSFRVRQVDGTFYVSGLPEAEFTVVLRFSDVEEILGSEDEALRVFSFVLKPASERTAVANETLRSLFPNVSMVDSVTLHFGVGDDFPQSDLVGIAARFPTRIRATHSRAYQIKLTEAMRKADPDPNYCRRSPARASHLAAGAAKRPRASHTPADRSPTRQRI